MHAIRCLQLTPNISKISGLGPSIKTIHHRPELLLLFNSLTFVVFFAVVLALHQAPFTWRTKKLNLLLASYVFYAAWNPPLVILIWISTMIDWWVAKRLFTEVRDRRRRALLLVSLITNLGILGSFKYGGFLLENFSVVMLWLGIDFQPAAPSIVLPVGISFYTFQTMAYSLDVYRRQSEPAQSFLDFALFVTFFPQLVAGPIVRPNYLIPQFAQPLKREPGQFVWGLFLMTFGLFQKVVIADHMVGPVSDKVFASEALLTGLDAWTGVVAFSAQIFCDFAGYSTVAIGAALCLGFHMPRNFRYPYAALGFSDFWRRWHITLSTWLRDYLYIPLGGNRRGPTRTLINLALTMLLGGLWHGAQWTFVVWGGLHGLYLAGERWVKRLWGNRPSGVGTVIIVGFTTWFFVLVAWVFFRAQDFSGAWRLLQAMFTWTGAEKVLTSYHIAMAWGVTAIMLGLHWKLRNQLVSDVMSRQPWWLVAALWAAMLFLLIASGGSSDAFIYFQF